MKRTPIRKVRSKPRPGRLKSEALALLRAKCFLRDKGLCVKCMKRLWYKARFDGDPDAYDMAHKRNRRMWGDSLDNVEANCHACHMEEHAYGPSGTKPVPPKPRLETL